MNIAEVLERMGSQATEEMLHEYYDGQSLKQINRDLDNIFPFDIDDNEELAQAIYNFVD